MTHPCRECGSVLPATDEFFYRAGGGVLFNWICKPCMKRYVAQRKRMLAGRPGLREVTCRHCGAAFESVKTKAFYCSRVCHDEAKKVVGKAERLASRAALNRTCQHCGQPMVGQRTDAKFCSTTCRDAAHQWWRKSAARTGSSRQSTRQILRAQIGERDGWSCALCDGEVDQSLRYPDPLSPSIDHIVPVSRGGSHEPDNLQLTHLRCNFRKRDRLVA